VNEKAKEYLKRVMRNQIAGIVFAILFFLIFVFIGISCLIDKGLCT